MYQRASIKRALESGLPGANLEERSISLLGSCAEELTRLLFLTAEVSRDAQGAGSIDVPTIIASLEEIGLADLAAKARLHGEKALEATKDASRRKRSRARKKLSAEEQEALAREQEALFAAAAAKQAGLPPAPEPPP